jgi:hypothetical protein
VDEALYEGEGHDGVVFLGTEPYKPHTESEKPIWYSEKWHQPKEYSSPKILPPVHYIDDMDIFSSSPPCRSGRPADWPDIMPWMARPFTLDRRDDPTLPKFDWGAAGKDWAGFGFRPLPYDCPTTKAEWKDGIVNTHPPIGK